MGRLRKEGHEVKRKVTEKCLKLSFIRLDTGYTSMTRPQKYNEPTLESGYTAVKCTANTRLYICTYGTHISI